MSGYPAIPCVRFPLMFQNWCGLTFLHWRIPMDAIAALVPRPLAVDTFDGSAWVGVTPFRLTGLHAPFCPPLPWLSAFPETNCRTYVREAGGARGIWFFSLDAARAAAVLGARLSYGLPYAWSQMRVEAAPRRMLYESRRHWPVAGTMTRIEVAPGEPIEAGEREIFLTARFRLYSRVGGLLVYAEVEHPPWPLQSARVVECRQTLLRAAGLPEPNEPPVAHFSPGVAVRVGPPRPLRA